jgi:hypothetical protein
MKRVIAYMVSGLLIAGCVASDAIAAEVALNPLERAGLSVTVNLREWLSQGKSAHSIAAPGHSPNVLSELTYQGLASPITELSVDVVAQERVILALRIGGGGSIGHGTLLDEDFTGNNRTGKNSSTLSRADGGHVVYVSADTGFRLLRWTHDENPMKGGIDLILGYQFWQERYVSSGVTDLLPPLASPIAAKAITQTNDWHSLRLGAQTTIPVMGRVTVHASAVYIPVSYYRSEDIHHLRTSLRQDPSFLTTASGGNGVQLEASLQVRVWERLFLEGGYRYWDIRSGSGTVSAYPTTGGVAVEPHNDEHTKRQGVFFGASWVF